MPKDTKDYCGFCSIPKAETKKLILGKSASVCIDCISLLQTEVEDHPDLPILRDMSPSAIVAHLDKYLVGQGAAKKALSVAIWNHFKRSFGRSKTIIQKSNVWLIGPSGSGKTAMLNAISKYLDVPFVSVDSSTITESGYVGDDPEILISKLYENAEGILEATEKGIVFIDEFDKLAKTNNSGQRDIKGAGVQQALLRMIEGDIISIHPNGKKKGGSEPIEKVDTKDILFILGGAFVGLQELKNKTPMGIEKVATKKSRKVLPTDLIKYGMIPELVGRVPIIVQTDSLDVNALVRVLTEPVDSLTKQYQSLLLIDGVKLSFSDCFLQKVAEEAIKSGTGARGLRTILENSLLDTMYKAPDMPGIGQKDYKGLVEVVLTAEDVK